MIYVIEYNVLIGAPFNKSANKFMGRYYFPSKTTFGTIVAWT